MTGHPRTASARTVSDALPEIALLRAREEEIVRDGTAGKLGLPHVPGVYGAPPGTLSLHAEMGEDGTQFRIVLDTAGRFFVLTTHPDGDTEATPLTNRLPTAPRLPDLSYASAHKKLEERLARAGIAEHDAVPEPLEGLFGDIEAFDAPEFLASDFPHEESWDDVETMSEQVGGAVERESPDAGDDRTVIRVKDAAGNLLLAQNADDPSGPYRAAVAFAIASLAPNAVVPSNALPQNRDSNHADNDMAPSAKRLLEVITRSETAASMDRDEHGLKPVTRPKHRVR